jgi:glycosyltransferase involved in cell wall biosynthesis
VRRILLLGTYPPRRCGIATFAAELRASVISANPDLDCAVLAVSDSASHDYTAEVTGVIRQNESADYLEAARQINLAEPDVLCVQHEFGIFGGPAGRYILVLLDSITCPIVSILHTVLEHPDEDQKHVFDRLLLRSDKLIVMSERGREVLGRVWGIPPGKVAVVPHGTPDRVLGGNDSAKAKLGFEGRDLLLTFGLLSPDKGIETVLRAMPAIIAARPKTVYLVSGVTHPNLLAQEGERYRESLLDLSTGLRLGESVCFVNEYLPTSCLLDTIRAADICIMPYKNEAQITSGTLSYAAGLGKAIISTPFWHAREILADGRGILIPFADPDAVAQAAIALLTHPEWRGALEQSVFESSREMVWSRLGKRYLEIFLEVRRSSFGRPVVSYSAIRRRRAKSSLQGVKRLTDDCGILQHSRLNLPDRSHGYCVDDNARALMLMHRLPGLVDEERRRLTSTYAAFVEHAWNETLGCFRNFMSYERKWLEDKGSEDCFGRSFLAAAVTATSAHENSLRYWARNLLDRAVPHIRNVSWPRSDAFLLIGMSHLVDAKLGTEAVHAIMTEKARRLAEGLTHNRSTDWPWFENHLTYDNARLPEALIRAGNALADHRLVGLGLESLQWLCKRQTSPKGSFRPVATADFERFREGGAVFDQQPLEAAATIDACEAALTVDRHGQWLIEAERAYDWYFGANDLQIALAEPDEGECCDGLTEAGVNLNQGAESVLAFQLATCVIQKLYDTPVSKSPGSRGSRTDLPASSEYGVYETIRGPE